MSKPMTQAEKAQAYAPDDMIPPDLSDEQRALNARWRYADGKSIVRVTEPTNRRWWQFWRPRLREQEYSVEAFTGRMQPLPALNPQKHRPALIATARSL